MESTRQQLDDSGAPEGNIRDVQAAPKVAVKMAGGQEEGGELKELGLELFQF